MTPATSLLPDRTDRRVLRTQTALRDAMLSLIAEKGWDALGVQDICERANVGRSTFYVHFQSKEALLNFGLGGLRTGLQEATTGASASRADAKLSLIARGLLEHLHEQRKLARAIIGRRSGQVVYSRFRAMVVDLVAAELKRSGKATWQHDANVQMIAGALMGLLTWRVDVPSPPPIDETVRQFETLIAPALRQLAA